MEAHIVKGTFLYHHYKLNPHSSFIRVREVEGTIFHGTSRGRKS